MTMIPNQINALDPNALASLKRQAKDNSPQAKAAAAKQFEAMFLQMVLKSMREATPSNGLTDNDQTRMYQSLLDQQLAQNLAQRGGTGLAQAMARQIGAESAGGSTPTGVASTPAAGFDLGTVVRQPARTAVPPAKMESPAAATPAAAGQTVAPAATQTAAPAAVAAPAASAPSAATESRRKFVERLWPHAEEASRATGIPARFLIAQAALETGWGKSELRHVDGSSSFNLFNIKAGKNWQGSTVPVIAREHVNGKPVAEASRFRSYPSYAEAFKDYARMITNNPRYANVVGTSDAAGFAQGLQRAGYATDPMYADKLTRIIGGATLRNALAA